LHPVAALSAAGRQLGRLLPLFLVALLGGRRGDGSYIFYFVLALGLVVSFATGIGGWLRFRYWVQGDELRVEHGLIVRRRIFVPRERIVAIEESSSVLERLFGLVRLRIKTAATGTQVELSAIGRAESQRLQSLLSSERRPEPGAKHAAPDARYVLGTKQLLLAASTSGRLGILLSGVAWLLLQLDDLVLPWMVERLGSAGPSTQAGLPSPIAVALLALATLTLAWLVSVGVEIVKFGGFSVERRGRDLIVRRGLLERREIVIALARIQAIVLVEGLLRQPLGYGSIVVESVGHAEEKGQSTLLHPFLHRAHWREFLQQVAPEHAVEQALERPPRRALVRFLLQPLVAFFLAVLVAASFAAGAVVLLPGLVLAAWLGILRFRDTGAGVSGSVLIVQSRVLRRRTALVARRSIQHCQLVTSVLQRRRRLSTFEVGVASGAGGLVIGARDLDDAFASRLLEWAAPIGSGSSNE
jgi:putative membrane protein